MPHVTHHDEADITVLDAYRKELDTAARADGYRVTLLAFLMKASVSGLKQFPEFNSSLSPEKDSLIVKSYYHLGVAVDTPEGLVVPVIRDVDRKGLTELSRELGDVSARARDGKLGVADLQGGTFTISSLGRHRRHRVHPDRERPRGRDPRRGPFGHETGVGWRGVHPAADAAAVPVL